MKITNSLVLLFILAYCETALSSTLYCLYLNSITIEDNGKIVSTEVFEYGKNSKPHPEDFFELNLDANTATYFWSEDDGKKGVTTEKITKINDQLFYARVNVPEYVGYSTYLFMENMRDGMLTENGYVSSFSCVAKNQKEIEEKFRISFSP